MGKAAAVINERKSAKVIIDEMVGEAVAVITQGSGYIARL